MSKTYTHLSLEDRALPRLDATQAEAVKAWQGRQ
jgi:hypothetical protein